MGKGKKLIILLLVAALLVGGYFAVRRFLTDEEEQTDAEEESIAVDAMHADDVTGVLYVSGDEKISLVRRDETWYLEEDAEFPVKQAYASTMAADAANLTARRLVSESADDFAQYGLAEPSTAYVFTLSDGRQVTYYIGNHNSFGDTYYMNVAGTEMIYLIEAAFLDDFQYSLSELADVPEMETASTNDVTALHMTLDGKTTDLFYKKEGLKTVYSDDFTWFIDEKTPADALTATDLIGNVVSYSATGCASYKADAAQIAQFGLDHPVLTAKIDYTETKEVETGETDENDAPVMKEVSEDKTLTLLVGGEAEDGSFYAKYSDGSIVYQIDPAYMQTLREFDYSTVASRSVCLVQTADIASVDVTIDGKKSTLAIKRSGSDSKASIVYTMDGEQIAAKAFNDFYASIQGMLPEGLTDKPTENAPEVTVVYHTTRKGFETMTLTFTPFDQNFYVTKLNDRYGVLVNRRDVEKVKSAFDALSGA